jgi:threonine dehydratase
LITAEDVADAARRIGPHVRRTGLWVSAPWSERHGATIAVKAEHTQHTGSFKLRGALNKVLGLDPAQRAAGIVTASSGNHGIATATAARIADTTCSVYLPAGASPAKVAAITRLGADIVTVDSTDAYRAEEEARAGAERTGATYVSPYNDRAVVAGQGTIGLEITADAPAAGLDGIDAVVAAVGGGGLISGIATWVSAHAPEVTMVGASPTNDRAMMASVEAGRVIEAAARPTFSDGTAGGIEPGTVTFAPCRDLVDEWVAVGEDDIARAVTAMIDDHHQLVEGAAGVALAAAADHARRHPGARIVVVSCGANVSAARLDQMLQRALGAGRS